MMEFELKKKQLKQLLWDGKIDINFFHSQINILEQNNKKVRVNYSDFDNTNRKPDTSGYRTPVMRKR